jgi:hypothetical protein
MEAYDFLHEWVKPIIKGDYQDFSSKKVEGYSLFVSEYKKPHVQAMVKADVLELLHNIVLCCAFLDIFCKKDVIHISYYKLWNSFPIVFIIQNVVIIIKRNISNLSQNNS